VSWRRLTTYTTIPSSSLGPIDPIQSGNEPKHADDDHSLPDSFWPTDERTGPHDCPVPVSVEYYRISAEAFSGRRFTAGFLIPHTKSRVLRPQLVANCPTLPLTTTLPPSAAAEPALHAPRTTHHAPPRSHHPPTGRPTVLRLPCFTVAGLIYRRFPPPPPLLPAIVAVAVRPQRPKKISRFFCCHCSIDQSCHQQRPSRQHFLDSVFHPANRSPSPI
jgi:hypothetical protein